MNKHPECEDCCQLLEHKSYHICSQTGVCAWLEQDKINAYANYHIKKGTGTWRDWENQPDSGWRFGNGYPPSYYTEKKNGKDGQRDR